jgi:hypothetical protein
VISRGHLEALLLDHVAVRGCPVASAADTNDPSSVVDGAEPLGLVLARFHTAVDDFEAPLGSEWTRPSRVGLMGDDPRWIERAYSHDPAEAAAMVEWWGLAAAALKKTPGSDLGMCHGEAHPATCRFVGANDLAIAELAWAGEGDRVYDFATFRWVLQLHAAERADDLFATFLDAYGAVRAVPDLTALGAWVAARHLWSLRLAVGFADPEGLSRRASFVATWPIEAR